MAAAVRGTVLTLFMATLAACGDSQPSTAMSGEQLYQRHCAACHGNRGKGVPRVFPPLANSEWLNLPDQRLAELVLRGLSGRLQVLGESYEGHMPAQRHLDDHAIAKILTYVRQQWGAKNAHPISEAQVAAARMLADLSQPLRAAELKPAAQGEYADGAGQSVADEDENTEGVAGEY